VTDVFGTLVWAAILAIGGARMYRDRVRAIDARRVESFVAWIGRPLAEPAGLTDWEAFERRVERELRNAVRPPSDRVLPYGP
jgi:hypothetical protein